MAPVTTEVHGRGDQQPWRQEVISRLEQHRARRRKRADPNALELDFPTPKSFAERGSADWQDPDGGTAEGREEGLAVEPEEAKPGMHEDGVPSGQPKIICFPVPAFARTSSAESSFATADEETAAGPDLPRILDADPYEETGHSICIEPVPVAAPAEQMDLLPSFDDIHLDEAAAELDEKPELIPEPAPLGQRIVAAAIDLGVVLIACLAFNMIFTRLAETDPHSRLATLCAMAVGGMLWMLYLYLFLVHGEGTPGMRLTALELATFAGEPVNRKGRRLRALASGLSGFSLGLGYGWALVDEDQLGWHDRMTGTLLKSRGHLDERGSPVKPASKRGLYGG